MTLKQAIEHFFKSDTFKKVSRQKDSEGGKVREYKTRFKRKELMETAQVRLLKKYGYKVTTQINVEPPKI
jgi:hypothetical protein